MLLPPGSRQRQCIPGGRRVGEEEGGAAVGAPQGAHPPEHDFARARRDGARHGLHRRRPQSCASAPVFTGLLALQDAVVASFGGGASSPYATLKYRASSLRLQGPCDGETASGVPARGVVAVTLLQPRAASVTEKQRLEILWRSDVSLYSRGILRVPRPWDGRNYVRTLEARRGRVRALRVARGRTKQKPLP
jgi:hypothetical protein